VTGDCAADGAREQNNPAEPRGNDADDLASFHRWSEIDSHRYDGITTSMRMNREETFGSVAGLLSLDNEDEAITLAKRSTEFCLAGYF
jgi:hypothetical protein